MEEITNTLNPEPEVTTAEVVEISGGAFQVRDPMYSWE